jgi:hypothetical protein
MGPPTSGLPGSIVLYSEFNKLLMLEDLLKATSFPLFRRAVLASFRFPSFKWREPFPLVPCLHFDKKSRVEGGLSGSTSLT